LVACSFPTINPKLGVRLSNMVELDKTACCYVAVAQINYPNLNKQDSIEQVRGQFNEEVLVQIFILYDV